MKKCKECKRNISYEEFYFVTPTGNLCKSCFCKLFGEEIEKHPIWSLHERGGKNE